MKAAKRKFMVSALLAVGVLLAVLLTAINVTNFTMAGTDADKLLSRLQENRGEFMLQSGMNRTFRGQGFGPMGPDSPEMGMSLRYFTVAFDDAGSAETLHFALSAVTEEEAKAWAKTLLSGTSGWTRGTYRYLVYRFGNRTLVSVIDQGRELVSPYRILVISLVGFALAMLLSWLVLRFAAGKFLDPVEEADRKQKAFISQAETELTAPIDAIAESNDRLERSLGETEETKNISHQLRKLKRLVGRLDTLALFEPIDLKTETVDLGEAIGAALRKMKTKYESRALDVRAELAENVRFVCDPERLGKALDEILDNAFKFAVSRVSITMTENNGRTKILIANDTSLKDGRIDQVFDKFVRLPNADGLPGAGLGLTYVRTAVTAHNGRAAAEVKNGIFTLRLDF